MGAIYNVGDIVRVRDDVATDEYYNNIRFVEPMSKFVGKWVTIKHAETRRDGTGAYHIVEDRGWWWSDSMFEHGAPLDLDESDFDLAVILGGL